MAEHKYPDFVQHPVIIVLSRKYQNSRLKLEVNFKRGGERLVVILKNPSKATKDCSDHTINNVLKYVEENLSSIGCVVIYNLFIPYETYSNKLISIYRQSSYQNLTGGTLVDKLLQCDLKKSSVSIVAWGNPPTQLIKEYQSRILEVVDIIHNSGHDEKVRYVEKITKKGYPLHAQVWSPKYTLHKAKFNGYKVI
jgi:hypothetical protein